MLPNFMPVKGVGLDPSCGNQAVCLGLPDLWSSGAGQGEGTDAKLSGTSDPSSVRLWFSPCSAAQGFFTCSGVLATGVGWGQRKAGTQGP